MKRYLTTLLILFTALALTSSISLAGDTYTCGKCGFENPVDNKFCNKCGQRIEAPLAGQKDAGSILAIGGDTVMIDRGSADGIKTGQTFQVFDLSNTVLDPETGDTLGIKTKPIAKIRIYDVVHRAAFGKVKVLGDQKPNVGDRVYGYIPGQRLSIRFTIGLGLCSASAKDSHGSFVEYINEQTANFALELALSAHFLLGFESGVIPMDGSGFKLGDWAIDNEWGSGVVVNDWGSVGHSRGSYGLYLKYLLHQSSELDLGVRLGVGTIVGDIINHTFDVDYGRHVVVEHNIAGSSYFKPGLDLNIRLSKLFGVFLSLDYLLTPETSSEVTIYAKTWNSNARLIEETIDNGDGYNYVRIYGGFSVNFYKTDKW